MMYMKVIREYLPTLTTSLDIHVVSTYNKDLPRHTQADRQLASAFPTILILVVMTGDWPAAAVGHNWRDSHGERRSVHNIIAHFPRSPFIVENIKTKYFL